LIRNDTRGNVMQENTTCEFKREFTNDINKEVIAFANTEGGKIFIGI